jgi:hypothetical protein
MVGPYIEEQFNANLLQATFKLQCDLKDERERCAELQRKYDLLLGEMERSRDLFSKKRQEWQSIREALSSKRKLKLLLDALQADQVCRVDQSVEVDLMSCARDSQETIPEAMGELAHLLDDSNEGQIGEQKKMVVEGEEEEKDKTENDSLLGSQIDFDFERNVGKADIVLCSKSTSSVSPPPPVTDDGNYARKRTTVEYSEPLRKKAARMQAHATDCPCCSRVFLARIVIHIYLMSIMITV